MSVAMNKLLLIALALVMTGCATARTLNAAKPGAPVVYAGTRLNMYSLEGGCCATDRFGAEAPSYPALDMPGSAVLDTLLLPLSLLTALGFGVQATGGL